METTATAFVTGATGAVGGALVRELVRRGVQVHALHRGADAAGTLQALGATPVRGDIEQAEVIRNCIPGGIGTVYHAAASLSVWSRNDAAQLRTNVEGTRNVVDAALAARAGRFVHVSSVSAYGRPGGPVTETTASVAADSFICYERTKWAAELEVRKGIACGLDAVIVNPCAIMGPGFTAGWATLLYQIKAGTMRALPPGSLVVNHIDDVVQALIAAAERGRSGENYILAGEPVPVATLVRRAGEIMGIPVTGPVLGARTLAIVARIGDWISRITGREPDLTPEMAAMMSQDLQCPTHKAARELGYRETAWEVSVEGMYRWLAGQGLI